MMTSRGRILIAMRLGAVRESSGSRRLRTPLLDDRATGRMVSMGS
jgi:hypothetical protein